jgi:hypothetical protein
MRITISIAASLLFTLALAAQSNVVTGLDGRLTSISNFSVVGSNTTHVGCAAQNDMCNPGTVTIPWYAAGNGGQMQENHPKFGFMVCRELNGRFEQISDRSFCKHAFTSVNGSGGCGTCQNPGTGSVMGINCTDACAVQHNGDRFWLGPADEIDPWLGTWNHVGSFFDQGVPNVGSPGNNDGVRSPINIGDSVTNRVTIEKADLGLAGAAYFYQIHLIHQGEGLGNRHDNLMSRPVRFTPSGSTFTSADNGGPTLGCILGRWTGATVTSGSNGQDDGRFFVGVKVTGPVAGLYHYEYAIHNVDNSRGGAALRIPVCSNAAVTNLAFRDIDDNALNDWTATVGGGEIVFMAPASNPQNWNTVYNFSFDCPVQPSLGPVTIDEARVGPGALSLSITTRTPNGGLVETSTITQLGSGCGVPTTQLFAATGPSVPNPNFAFVVISAPNAGMILAFSSGTASLPMGPFCTQYLDPQSLGVHGFLVGSPSGVTMVPMPIPAGLQPFTLNFQVAQFITGGPVLGAFGLSNGLQIGWNVTGGCP